MLFSLRVPSLWSSDMGQGNMGVPTTTHFASELKQPDCLSTLHCRIVKNFGRITNNKVTSYHASRAQVTMLLIFQWVVGRGELLHAYRPPGQISHFRSCLAAKAIVDDPGLFQYSRTPASQRCRFQATASTTVARRRSRSCLRVDAWHMAHARTLCCKTSKSRSL